MRRAENDRRREIIEQTRRLAELRANVKKEEGVLAALVKKKDTVGVAISRWKEHVEQLRDLHHALSAGPLSASADFTMPPRRGE